MIVPMPPIPPFESRESVLLALPGERLAEILRREPSALDRLAAHGVLFVVERILDGVDVGPSLRERIAVRRAEERLSLRAISALLPEALGVLEAAGAPALVLKGVPLGARLFGDPLLRPSGDLDLLVAPDRFDDAAAALVRAGFRATGPRRESGQHVAFLRGGAPPLELHFRPHAALPSGETRGLLERAVETPVCGLVVRVLAPEDERVLLSAHAAAHAFGRLGWLLDLARHRELHPLGRAALDERASRWRLRRALAFADLATEAAFGGGSGAPVPLRAAFASALREKLLDESNAGVRSAAALALWDAVLADDAAEAVAAAARAVSRALGRTR